MPVTIRDIAKQVNLSHTTVSRALNGGEAINIPASTRERIRQVAREMGYLPNRDARALASGRTNRVVLRLFRLDSPFCAQVARSLQARARNDGYEVLVQEFAETTGETRSVDGVFWLDRNESATASGDAPVPQVFLGSFCPGSGDCARVALASCSQTVMRVLLQGGRRRIAYMGRPDALFDGRNERLQAYNEALQIAGLAPERIAVLENTRAYGWHSLAEYGARQELPDALFCENDELAAGCLRAVRDAGKTVPGDVAIVGCDGTDEGDYLYPALTTIAQPVEAMCDAAWELLTQRIADPVCEQRQVFLPAQMRWRGSHAEAA